MPRGRILRAGELEPEGYGQTGHVTREGGEVLRMFEMMQPEGQMPGQMPAMGGAPEGIDMPKGLINRRKYESFLKEKYGSPYEDERDLIKNINQTTRTNEAALFEHVFGRNFRYEDRKHLDSKAQSYWKNSLLKYRKQVEDSLTQDIESRKEMFENQMESFDDYTKMFKPAKPAKPKYKQIFDMTRKINEEMRSPSSGEMLIFDKLTESTDIKVRPTKEGVEIIKRETELMGKDTPENIREKYKKGEISREEALELLKKTGM